MNKIVTLIGASGHAKVVRDAFQSRGVLVGSVYDDTVKEWLEFSIISPIPLKIKSTSSHFISIGNNEVRKIISQNIVGVCATIIHQLAYVTDDVKIGSGTCIMAGSVVQPGSIIGGNCIINTNASIDHDCIIADYVHISPNATLCGNVSIGEGAHIGAGAIIIPGIKVGKWSTIGAGAVIIDDVPDYATVVGSPGKVIKIKP